MSPLPQGTADSAEMDRATFQKANADAGKLAHDTGSDTDTAPTGKTHWPGTTVGAPCDLAMVKPLEGPDRDQNFPNHPDRRTSVGVRIDDGVRIDSAGLVPNPEQAQDYGTPRYDSAKHDQIAADLARSQAKSGTVPPTLDLGVPSTYGSRVAAAQFGRGGQPLK